MAEINQPTPVKPVWPVRRDRKPPEKRQSEPVGEEERERRRGNREHGDKLPRIDEYA